MLSLEDVWIKADYTLHLRAQKHKECHCFQKNLDIKKNLPHQWCWLKTTVEAKSYKIKKNLLLKYQHVADVAVDFYSCATCLKGVFREEVERHYNPSIFKKFVCRKVALLKSLKFTTSKEPNSHSWWATGLILVSKYLEFRDLQSYRDVFLISEFWKKVTPSRFSGF